MTRTCLLMLCFFIGFGISSVTVVASDVVSDRETELIEAIKRHDHAAAKKLVKAVRPQFAFEAAHPNGRKIS